MQLRWLRERRRSHPPPPPPPQCCPWGLDTWQHHEYRGPIGFAVEYATPGDDIISNYSSTFVLPVVLGVHPVVWLVWIAFRLLQTYETHSGSVRLRADVRSCVALPLAGRFVVSDCPYTIVLKHPAFQVPVSVECASGAGSFPR